MERLVQMREPGGSSVANGMSRRSSCGAVAVAACASASTSGGKSSGIPSETRSAASDAASDPCAVEAVRCARRVSTQPHYPRALAPRPTPGSIAWTHELHAENTAEKAQTLAGLYAAPQILRVVNVWDVVSALPSPRSPRPRPSRRRATPSPRPSATPTAPFLRDLMLDMVGRIAAAVDLPVTADLDDGYDDAGETTRRAIGVGVVGANIEDRLRPLSESVAGVEAIVRRARPRVSPSCSTPAPTPSPRRRDGRRRVDRRRHRARSRLPRRRRDSSSSPASSTPSSRSGSSRASAAER